MNFSDTLFSTIDLRSFSNLWFWIILAVAWSNVTHFVMGVPFDMVLRAKRRGGAAMDDLQLMAGLQARRRVHVMQTSGVWLVGFWMAVCSALATLGFYYGHELAQAMALLLAPLTLAGLMSLRLALRIGAIERDGPALVRLLTRYRIGIQAIGLLTIFLTTMWGMWQNLSIRALGG